DADDLHRGRRLSSRADRRCRRGGRDGLCRLGGPGSGAAGERAPSLEHDADARPGHHGAPVHVRGRLGPRGAERLFRAVCVGRMTTSRGLARPRPAQAARVAAGVLIVAASAWAATLTVAGRMAAMPGTMGLGLAGFVPTWTLMMAAMMLPSVAPTASLYAK